MSFGNILYSILISPLQLIFEAVFTIAHKLTKNPGLSIFVLSLAINFLVLPLYRRADAIQGEERDIEAKLKPGVDHIKKTFSGDERMMILQTYYRQNNYKPTYVLRSVIPLMLEIPFFIAAYNYLSNLAILEGVKFGPLNDLAKPDALLTIAGITINVLPILMTLINIISSTIFSKDYPVKTKIQLYAMALFFLVFLYKSPSGLVLYWTLNNAFSLVKTIFYKVRHSGVILSVLFALSGLFLIVTGISKMSYSLKRLIFCIFAGIALLLVSFFLLRKEKSGLEEKNTADTSSMKGSKSFLICSLFLTLLVGVLIPSGVIKTSPLEFFSSTAGFNPLWYIVSSLCIAAGTFLVWFFVFYSLAASKGKKLFEIAVSVLCAFAAINYMFFGKRDSLLTPNFSYETDLIISWREIIINTAILAAAATLIIFASRKWNKAPASVIAVCSVALVCMSGFNVKQIADAVSAYSGKSQSVSSEDDISISLSKNGKNVIVFMLDRAMGEYIPYIMDEKPELMDKFDGFTYYSNTISFGAYTNFGTPALFGGYEYTPLEMNLRSDEPLVDKHNEALLVLPRLFSENDFNVSVFDPPYAGYSWIPDLSIYDEYPGIKTGSLNGRFNAESSDSIIENRKRNSFCYSIVKCMPLCIQPYFYDYGEYLDISRQNIVTQRIVSSTKSVGYFSVFMDEYSQLCALSDITTIDEGSTNSFIMMANETTHEPMMLQEPEYEPTFSVDNAAFDADRGSQITVNGKSLKMENVSQIIHYQSNVAALLQFGNWLDYLKENGVYDNTRIILVSDHGRDLDQIDDLIVDLENGTNFDVEWTYPLLMVKDFNAKGFSTSSEFMTNADVPTIAVNGLIDNPVNPFTGKEINSDEKAEHDQCILFSFKWDVNTNNGNRFQPDMWLSVHDDIWDPDNWTLLAENAEMPD